MTYTNEGFKMGPSPEKKPLSDETRYRNWLGSRRREFSKIDGKEIFPLNSDTTDIVRTYFRFMIAAEEGKTYSTDIFCNGYDSEMLNSKKARDAVKPRTRMPREQSNWMGNYDIIRIRGIQVWFEESWVGIGSGPQSKIVSSYHGSLSDNTRLYSRVYFLSEGDPRGNWYVDGKPAVTIWKANFEPENVRNFVRIVEERTGAKVITVDRPIEKSGL